MTESIRLGAALDGSTMRLTLGSLAFRAVELQPTHLLAVTHHWRRSDRWAGFIVAQLLKPAAGLPPICHVCVDDVDLFWVDESDGTPRLCFFAEDGKVMLTIDLDKALADGFFDQLGAVCKQFFPAQAVAEGKPRFLTNAEMALEAKKNLEALCYQGIHNFDPDVDEDQQESWSDEEWSGEE